MALLVYKPRSKGFWMLTVSVKDPIATYALSVFRKYERLFLHRSDVQISYDTFDRTAKHPLNLNL